jgi:hypothetical protein
MRPVRIRGHAIAITRRVKMILTSNPNPIDPAPGIYRGVPWEEYAAWDCFSKSMVGPALRSGKHLEHYIKNGRKTDAMTRGSLVDTLLFEPELYNERYAIQPSTYTTTETKGRGANKVTKTVEKQWNLNSHTCQAIAAEIKESGKEVITRPELQSATEIVKAIRENDEAARVLDQGEFQVSIVWIDERTGVKCKGRIDILGEWHVDDLKTARDASPNEFSRAIGQYDYHVQAFAYTDAMRQLGGKEMGFRFIVAETSGRTETPAVALYELDSVSIVAGGLRFRRALANVANWREHGARGYSPFFEPIAGPYWAIEKEINMTEEEVEL